MIHRSIWTRRCREAKARCFCALILCIVMMPGFPRPVSGAPDSEIENPLERISSSTIRVGSYLVTVPVSVTDASGQTIRGMNIGDFKITEDGNPQTISRIAEADEIPLRLALLFDLSGSVHSRFEFEKQAATRFLRKVWKDGDTVCIVAFSEQPQIQLQRSVFVSEALQELAKLQPTENSTALFDSVVLSSRLVHQSATPETRQALVVLSDGADNRSEHDLIDTLKEVQYSDAIFYAINPSAASVRLNEVSFKGQENLSSLASATGGTAFVSGSPDDLDAIFGRIASELRTQYLLGYYSSNPLLDGRFRQIKVILEIYILN